MIRTFSSSVVAATCIVAVAAPAQAAAREYHIPPGSLKSALDSYAKHTGRQIIYRADEVGRARSNGATGTMSDNEALKAILANSGFSMQLDSSGAVAVVKLGNAGAGDAVQSAQPANEKLVTDDDQQDVIIVTGTNIRGIAPDSSPTKVFTRKDIEKSGAATAQEFISKLPENFGGGSNASIPGGLPNDSSAGGNTGGFGSYGSSVNLRGLGSGSTLVLLNGHRIAPSSVLADFADISMIPASAIERVETLTDGASSIYGSDAVAGVVNFILRDDFDGLEASLRYGTGTQGGAPGQFRASLTGGTNWGSGHALAAYEHFGQQHLSVDERDFALKAFAPSYLLPSQKRDSLFTSVSQDVTSRLSVHGDLLYSKRSSQNFRRELTGQGFQYNAKSKALNASLGATWQVSRDWFVDLTGVYGRVDTRNATSGYSTQLRRSKSDQWNIDGKITGPVVALPAGDVKIAIGGQARKEAMTSFNQTAGLIDREAARKVYSLFGEAFVPLVGQPNNVPGIRRLELNLSGRYSHYNDFGSTFDPKIGLLLSPVEGLNLRGSYSTSFKAPALGQVGARDFGASLLPSSFVFNIFHLTPADPSLANVLLLTVGGTDKNLKAETSRSFTAGLDYSKKWGSNKFSGSATWFDINYKNRLGSIPIPGNVINFDAINIAYNNPAAFPAGSFTFQPSQAEIDDVLSSLDTPLGNPFHLDPHNAYFISRVMVVTNIGRSVVRGMDFRLSYSRSLPDATVDLGLDGTYLKRFDRQATSASPIVPYINTLFNPVGLKMRGHVGYSSKNLSATMFVNYTDKYKVNDTPGAGTVKSWTTADLTVTLDTKDNLGGSFLRQSAVRLSISNLFDRDPPKIPLNSGLWVDGYDPTNASPLGRFVSLELIKRF